MCYCNTNNKQFFEKYLLQFALINMNGRMYDPVIGKMLAPDINIPDPYSAVGYNRYSYAFDNPLLYTDPSGWLSEEAIQDIFDELNNNSDPYGASYTPGETPSGGSGGSWTSFGSDADTFDEAAAYATEFGLWGKYGFAPSFAYAQEAYYLQYNGRDPGVASLLPPIVVVGKIVNDQWQTSQYNGHDLVFYPGQYTEDKNGVITVQWGGDPMEGRHWYNWDGPIMRALVPDKLTISIGADMAAFLGVGTQPLNFTLLTRGHPALILTPSVNAELGVGASASFGINFGIGYYTGNPQDITPSMVRGSSYGITATGGYLGDFSIGGSYQ